MHTSQVMYRSQRTIAYQADQISQPHSLLYAIALGIHEMHSSIVSDCSNKVFAQTCAGLAKLISVHPMQGEANSRGPHAERSLLALPIYPAALPDLPLTSFDFISCNICRTWQRIGAPAAQAVMMLPG